MVHRGQEILSSYPLFDKSDVSPLPEKASTRTCLDAKERTQAQKSEKQPAGCAKLLKSNGRPVAVSTRSASQQHSTGPAERAACKTKFGREFVSCEHGTPIHPRGRDEEGVGGATDECVFLDFVFRGWSLSACRCSCHQSCSKRHTTRRTAKMTGQGGASVGYEKSISYWHARRQST